MLVACLLTAAIALAGLCQECNMQCGECRADPRGCANCTHCAACWPPKHTVSGISSGGSMAVLHHVAYSSTCLGASVVAGSGYGCNTLPAAGTTCCTPPASFNWTAAVREMDAYLRNRSTHKMIDPAENLAVRPVWLFSGTKDTVVYQPVMQAVRQQFRDFSAAPASEFSIPAEHAWIVNDTRAEPCAHLGAPFLNNCEYDMSRTLLTHTLGALRGPTPEAMLSSLQTIDARPYFATHEAAALLGCCFYAYVPRGCGENVTSCRLHVQYHGCQAVGPAPFGTPMTRAYGTLEGLAEANDIVIVYPQARRTLANPYACWDWIGTGDPDFDTQDGVQLFTVSSILGDLAHALARQPPESCPEEVR
ncbi:polyhydroxybutyrate depolymerase [Diplonema papillatum]|nr:polyhydroxybutyrate depolymerase [Diplonema papillatum]